MRAIILLACLFAGCARPEAAKREFELWRPLPHVYAPIDPEVAADLFDAARRGVRVRPNEIELRYLTVEGRSSAGAGPLVRLYTREELIPAGTFYVALRRTHALNAAGGVPGAVGTCVDAETRGACRAALSLEETAELGNLIHSVTDMEQPLAFEMRRRP